MSEGEQAAEASERGKASERGPAARVGDGPLMPDPFERERVGPLRIERTRKDDGRTLIFYWEAEHTR